MRNDVMYSIPVCKTAFLHIPHSWCIYWKALSCIESGSVWRRNISPRSARETPAGKQDTRTLLPGVQALLTFSTGSFLCWRTRSRFVASKATADVEGLHEEIFASWNMLDPIMWLTKSHVIWCIRLIGRSKVYSHRYSLHSPNICSLVPRPFPLRGKRGLVNIDTFLGYVGGAVYLVSYNAETDLHSDWLGQKCGQFNQLHCKRKPTLWLVPLNSCGK